MKEVLLHIGIHKTGSSSIQHSLAGFDDGRTIYCGFDKNHSIAMYTIFSKNRHSYHIWRRQGMANEEIERKRASYIEQLRNDLQRNDRERLVISGEDISLLKDDEKAELIEFLRGFGVNVKVVAYVRNPVDYCTSAYQQMMQMGLKDLVSIPLHYRNLLSGFLDEVPRDQIVVKKFDRNLLFRGDIVEDFCREIAVEIDTQRIERSNEALSADAAKLIWALNSLPISTEGSYQLLYARGELVEILQKAYSGRGKLENHHFLGHVDCTEADLQFLRENFGIHYEHSKHEGESTLAGYLDDLSNVDLNILDELCASRNICLAAHRDVQSKLAALFYFTYYSRAIARSDELERIQAQIEELKSQHWLEVSRIQSEAVCFREQLGAAADDAERLRADASARRSKLAERIDRCDYLVHKLISDTPFLPGKVRRKFGAAALRRKRPRYDS